MSASASYFVRSSPTDGSLNISPKRLLHTEASSGFHNGAQSFRDQNPEASGPERALRSLTVNEALQYSPLSSIVPFDPSKSLRFGSDEVQLILLGTVSLPTADVHALRSVYPSPTEKHTARQHIENLNKHLEEERGQAGFANKALESLQSLLDPNKLPRLSVSEFLQAVSSDP